MLTELVKVETKVDFFKVIPIAAPFANVAQQVIEDSIPLWLISSSAHHRKAYYSLSGEKLDNTQGHILPIIQAYLNDCALEQSVFSKDKIMCYSMHDTIEDYDDFVEDEEIEAGLAPNKPILEEMQAIGVNDFVLAVVLTCTKDRERKQETDVFRRDRNLLFSLSANTANTPQGKTNHALKLAQRLCDYGYIQNDEVETWQNTFLALDYDQMMSVAREVKLRDRFQSISQDLELMEAAVSEGRYDISGLNYVEKTRVLLMRMYGEDKPTKADELMLFNRLKTKMNRSIKFEMENIFQKAFLQGSENDPTDGNDERYKALRKLFREQLFDNAELSSYLDLALLMKDFVLGKMKDVISLKNGEPQINAFIVLADILKQEMPDIFTFERTNTNHFTYFISILLSGYAFDLYAKEEVREAVATQNKEEVQHNKELLQIIESADQKVVYQDQLETAECPELAMLGDLRLVPIRRVKPAEAYVHLENLDIEGFFLAAFDCYNNIVNASDKYSRSVLYDFMLKLYGYYTPIMEEFGFTHIVQRFNNLTRLFMREPGFTNYSASLNRHKGFCENLDSYIESVDVLAQIEQSGLFSRKQKWTKKRMREGIVKRLKNIISPSEAAFIVLNDQQRERLEELGFGLAKLGFYGDTLYRVR